MESLLRIPSVTGVDLELRVAGPGGRSYAFIIDWHIRVLAALTWLLIGVVALPSGWPVLPGETANAAFVYVVLLPSTALYFLYHPILEIAMRGQTPGKRIAGVRIVTLADGGSPSVGALLIRNVFRLIDAAPGLYAIGLIATLLTKYSVRVGDIAAGTVLVYDEARGGKLLDDLHGVAVERLGLAHAQLVHELLDRWPELGESARTTLAAQLLGKLGVDAPQGDAELRAKLEELVA
jgi:uncharacterized RDD family membrane protein YckC